MWGGGVALSVCKFFPIFFYYSRSPHISLKNQSCNRPFLPFFFQYSFFSLFYQHTLFFSIVHTHTISTLSFAAHFARVVIASFL